MKKCDCCGMTPKQARKELRETVGQLHKLGELSFTELSQLDGGLWHLEYVLHNGWLGKSKKIDKAHNKLNDELDRRRERLEHYGVGEHIPVYPILF